MPSTPIISKKEVHLRWQILLFAIGSSFGVEYSFDNPSVLKDMLYEHFKADYTIENFEIYYSFFYSSLAIPNVVVPFVIGYFIDKLGVRRLYSLLALFSVIGQSIISTGVEHKAFLIIYGGRMILGMACESMAIVQSIFLGQYFYDHQLSFIVGGIYSLANLGGVLNLYLTPRIALAYGLGSAFWFSAILCGCTCLMTLHSCYLDWKSEQEIEKNTKLQEFLKIEEEEWEVLSDTRSSSELDVLETRQHSVEGAGLFSNFPPLFWYICAATALSQSSIMSFDVIGVSYISHKWFASESVDQAEEDSGEVFSFFRIALFLCSPFFGYFIDKFGKRPYFLCMGCAITMVAHLLVIYIRPILPCIMFGIGLTLIYTSCWPSVMLLVDPKNVGKACGLITSMENIGLVILPIIDGLLKNWFGSYDDSEIFLALLCSVGLFMGIKLYKKDLEEGGVLSQVRKQKIEY